MMTISLNQPCLWAPSLCSTASAVHSASSSSWRTGVVVSVPQTALAKSTRRVVSNLKVSAKLPDVTEADFDKEVLQSSVPVIVDFWATWCGPCRLIVPVLESASKEYGDKLKIVKVEVDSNPKLVEKYKVYGLPSVVLFENGDAVPGGQFEGALTKAKLQGLLKEKLPALAA